MWLLGESLHFNVKLSKYLSLKSVLNFAIYTWEVEEFTNLGQWSETDILYHCSTWNETKCPTIYTCHEICIPHFEWLGKHGSCGKYIIIHTFICFCKVKEIIVIVWAVVINFLNFVYTGYFWLNLLIHLYEWVLT